MADDPHLVILHRDKRGEIEQVDIEPAEPCTICVWHDIPGEEPRAATTTITIDNEAGLFGPDHKATVDVAVCETCAENSNADSRDTYRIVCLYRDSWGTLLSVNDAPNADIGETMKLCAGGRVVTDRNGDRFQVPRTDPTSGPMDSTLAVDLGSAPPLT